jgi:hypothetical protein
LLPLASKVYIEAVLFVFCVSYLAGRDPIIETFAKYQRIGFTVIARNPYPLVLFPDWANS